MIMNVMQALRRASSPVVLAISLVVTSAVAQPQNKPSETEMATAVELIKVTGATALFTPLIAGVVEQAKLVFLQQNPGLSKDLNEISANIRDELTPRFSELTDEVARLYVSHFTEQDLKQILAFYKSPVGQKMLKEQPVVVDASMRFAQDWASNLSDEVINKMRDALRKKGHNL